MTTSILRHPEIYALVSIGLLAAAVTWVFMERQGYSTLYVIALLLLAAGLFSLERFALRVPLMDHVLMMEASRPTETPVLV